eukprot:1151750-Pelagomonas_calceolata.AAC.17
MHKNKNANTHICRFHHFQACFEDKNYECEECGKQVTQTVRNTALEAICSKPWAKEMFEFKQQALLAIQKAINKASSE